MLINEMKYINNIPSNRRPDCFLPLYRVQLRVHLEKRQSNELSFTKMPEDLR